MDVTSTQTSVHLKCLNSTQIDPGGGSRTHCLHPEICLSLGVRDERQSRQPSGSPSYPPCYAICRFADAMANGSRRGDRRTLDRDETLSAAAHCHHFGPRFQTKRSTQRRRNDRNRLPGVGPGLRLVSHSEHGQIWRPLGFGGITALLDPNRRWARDGSDARAVASAFCPRRRRSVLAVSYLETRERYLRLHEDYRDLHAQLGGATDRDDRREIWKKITDVEMERQEAQPTGSRRV